MYNETFLHRYLYGVYGDTDIKMSHSNFHNNFENLFSDWNE